MSKTLEVKQRYNELVAGGMTGKEAAKAVQEEFRNSATLHTTQDCGSRATAKPESREKHQERSDPSERREVGEFMEREETDEPVAVEYSEHDDRSYQEGHSSRPLEISEDRMREIAREVFEEMHKSIGEPRGSMREGGEWPEEPKAIDRRRQARKYLKISVTVDKALWELFEAERNNLESSGRKVSSGRLLDRILWLYYGKPALSYERSEPSLSSDPSEQGE